MKQNHNDQNLQYSYTEINTKYDMTHNAPGKIYPYRTRRPLLVALYQKLSLINDKLLCESLNQCHTQKVTNLGGVWVV